MRQQYNSAYCNFYGIFVTNQTDLRCPNAAGYDSSDEDESPIVGCIGGCYVGTIRGPTSVVFKSARRGMERRQT